MTNTIFAAGICVLLIATQSTALLVENGRTIEHLGQPLAQYGTGNYGNYGNGGNYGNYGNGFDQSTNTRSPFGYGTSNDINSNPINSNPFYDPTNPLSATPGSNSYDSNFNNFGSTGGTNNFNGLGGTYGVSGFTGLNAGADGIDENSFCPEFWIAFRNTCYRFIKSPKRNWYDAKKICQAHKGDLINVENVEKHSFILKHLIVQDNKQNRYYVSARQVAPNSWTNDDGSSLVNVDDGFAFEDTDFDIDTLQENLQDTNRYDNRFDSIVRKDQNPLYNMEKTRLVYGYSRSKDRWHFIPVYEFEKNLFICESHTLYNINNINIKQDDHRRFDYGIEITTEYAKIPRGPYFVNQPNETTFDTGKRKNRNDVTISCLAFGYPTPTYTWYKEEYDNDNLTFHRIDPLSNSRYTISGGNLIIYNPDQTLDQGTYHCIAENKFGRIRSESVPLNFGYIMEFNLKRSNEAGNSNWGHSLFCDPPQHYPGVQYYWSRDFFPNYVQEDQRVFVSHDGALYFSALEIIDRANYSCTVQSLVSSTGRNGPFFPLRSNPHPNYQDLIIANSFPKVFPASPVAGSDIRLECMAFDYPVPKYNWTRKDGGLPRRAYQINYNGRHNGHLIVETEQIIIEKNTLQLFNLSLLDAGEYECVAKSSVNEISSKSSVIVLGPPGAPGGVKVIEIHKTTARLEWIDGTSNGRDIIYYNILGRTNWNKTWVNVSEGVIADEIDRYNGRKHALVTGLTPWSGYEFSVSGVNDLGIGTPSAPSPLYNTIHDKPYIHPSNVGGGGGKIGYLTIKWKPLLSQEQNARGIHYKIYWRLHDTINNRTQNEWASDVLKEHGNTDRAIVQIPTKMYFTKYDVKVQAINDVGYRPESPQATIYSAEDMPQVAPQQPVAVGFNSTCFNVTWNPINQTREAIRGNLIGHRLKYWKQGHKEEDAVYYLSRSKRPWALIVGLEPDTHYFVKVIVYDAAGEGPESERYLERTYRKAPQKPPSSVQLYGVNPSTVRVVWRYVGVTMEEEPIKGYKVRVWESDQDMSTANDTIILIGNKLECYVDTLTPGKAYKMRVLAYSNGGDGRMSSPTLHLKMGNTNSRNMATNLHLNNTIICGILVLFYSVKQIFY